MADRSNLKKFLENDRIKPDDYLHENAIDNNNDNDAVDLNCNNNNNNESYCSEAQCLGRTSRTGRGAKAIASEGSVARRQSAMQYPLEENFKSCSNSQATERGFHPLNATHFYPELESFSGAPAPGVRTSPDSNRKPSNEIFFGSESRNFLSAESVLRDSPPRHRLNSPYAENLSQHFISYGNSSAETDAGENSFHFDSSEITLCEKRKTSSEEMGNLCFEGIDGMRGFRESIPATPEPRKHFRSHSRYATDGSFNPDSGMDYCGAETNSTGIGKCVEYSATNRVEDSMHFSSQYLRKSSENFSSSFSEAEPKNSISFDQDESFHSIPLQSSEKELTHSTHSKESTQSQHSARMSPKNGHSDASGRFQPDSFSEIYSCTFSENNFSDFVGTENDFSNPDKKENGSFNIDRQGGNLPPCGRGESCGFQGECEAFECESCLHCSSETFSNSSYSDCGPDCECRGRHSVSPELCDPATQVPEVRWTARLLGGDEKEVEAFKAKKIASMKK